MSKLLLVGVTPDEEATLCAAVGPESCRVVPVEALAGSLDQDEVDAVVIGSATASPLSAVQWVHRAEPLCGVLLLTSVDSDAALRRSATYSPDMPSTLAIVTSGGAEMAQVATEVLEAGRRRRVHADTLEAVTSREQVPTPQSLVPASLGALLDHAPFGVLVGDLSGRLVTWNRWAGDRLGLSNDATGEPLPSLIPAHEYLEHAFAMARAARLDSGVAPTTVEAPGDTVLEVSASPTRLENGDLAVLVLLQDVSARRQAERTRDRLAEHVGLLGRVSEALSGTLDVEMALRRLADQVVPVFADWISLQTYDQRGQSRHVVVRHRDPEHDREAHLVQSGLVGGLGEDSPSRQVAKTGGPVLLRTVSEDDLADFVTDPRIRDVVRRMGVASVVSVPLPGRDEMRGSMTLVRKATSPPYTPQDLAVGVEVGRRAGVALDTLSLYARQRDLAAELQRSLLTDPPQTEQAEVAVRYVAAAEEAQVGGDWYDAFLQVDGSTVLVIGDVMGHDTRSAAAMGQLRALLRGIGYTTSTGPAEMLSRLDAAIEGLRVQTTATGLVVQIAPHADGATGPAELCWSNAGHPPAIVVPPGGGAVVLENDEPDLLLGVLAHTDRQESVASLPEGGTLLLYTDGLVERRGGSIDEGIATLTAAVDRLSGLPLAQMCDEVLAEMLPENNDDDVALVAVRLRARHDGSGEGHGSGGASRDGGGVREGVQQ